MPFDRPSLATLIRRAQSDLAARLTGSDPRLRRSIEYVLARVVAAAAHGLHGHQTWIANQVIPDRAEAEYLERWAGLWGVERKPAAPAAGPVQFPGTDGSVIPAGTTVRRQDGALYTSSIDATIASGVATFDVEAVVAGAAGNLAADGLVSLVSPIVGVSSSGTVDEDGLVGGVEIESDPALLSRLLSRIQTPPKSGGPGDYVAWALEVPGVTRAWEYARKLGLGTVVVVFVMDDQEGSIIPGTDMVEEVQAYIDARAPVTCDVTVSAPTESPVNFELSITPNTSAIRAAVEASLAAMIRRDAEPDGVILHSHMTEAISTSAGESDHELTTPAADFTPDTGGIPVIGTITWS